MHLFTRTRQVDTLQGPEAFALATDMAHLASQVTGLEVIPWTSVFGLPLGAVVYSARVESQAAVADALARVSANPGYQRLVAESGRRLYTGLSEDAIAEFVSFAASGESTANFASVIVAQCAPGRIAEATAWGIDILTHASKLTAATGPSSGPCTGRGRRSSGSPWPRPWRRSTSRPRRWRPTGPTSSGSTTLAPCSCRLRVAAPAATAGLISHEATDNEQREGEQSCRSTCSKRSTPLRACVV